MNPKLKYLEIKSRALIAELQRLTSRISNPALTREQLDDAKAEVEVCKKKLRELGLPFKDPSEK